MVCCGGALGLGEVFDEFDNALMGDGTFEAVRQFALFGCRVDVFHAAYGANVDGYIFAGGMGHHVCAVGALNEVCGVALCAEGDDVGDAQLCGVCFEGVEDVLCGDVCVGGDCVVCSDVQG